MIENYDVYILNRREKISFLLSSGILFCVSSYLFYNNVIISLLFFTLAFPAQKVYALQLADKRKRELTYQFRDLLYELSSSISAGRQMREALIEAEKNMKFTYGDEALICRELTNMVIGMEESGETEETVFNSFAVRSKIKDINSFVDVYRIGKKTGADMERVIRKTVGVLLDRIELEKEVRTLTAQKRFEFAILIAMPLFMLLFLRISSPSYMSAMYETTAGRVLMTFSYLSVGAAAYAAYKITNIRL